MHVPRWLVIASAMAGACGALPATDVPLTGHANTLYQRAATGKFFAESRRLNPKLIGTSDGESFLVAWTPTNPPSRWLVSLHGTEGFATDDLAIWRPLLKNREMGILCLQWWLGPDTRPAYYSPEKIYHELDLALKSLDAKTNSVL